jgi:hypothetical protein
MYRKEGEDLDFGGVDGLVFFELVGWWMVRLASVSRVSLLPSHHHECQINDILYVFLLFFLSSFLILFSRSMLM